MKDAKEEVGRPFRRNEIKCMAFVSTNLLLTFNADYDHGVEDREINRRFSATLIITLK